MSNLVVRKITSPDGGPVSFPNGIQFGSGISGSNVNNIGIAGQLGFGVGICPSIPTGYVKLVGTEDIASDNYGNYQYSDGSVMVWIPAFFYKIGTGANGFALNVIDVKPFSTYADVATANAAGYALHRAFYDGGAIQPGVFVDKYLCSNNNGVASSIKNCNPLSSASTHNPYSALNGAPTNTFGGSFAVVKTRGSNFFVSSRFVFAALATLAIAHGQASTSTTWCAWYDAAGVKNFPKGNNNNALGDVNDATLSFVSDGNENSSKTGSANFIARTTHNGQNSGVTDLNGNMLEVTPGLTAQVATSTGAGYTTSAAGFAIGTTSIPLITGTGTVAAGDMITFAGDPNQYAVTTGIAAPGTIVISPGLKVVAAAAATAISIVPSGFYVLKTSAAMKSLTGGNTLSTDGFGGVGIVTNYDLLGATFGAVTGSATAKYYGSATQVLSESVNGANWQQTGLGVPLATGVGGSNLFGQDGLWDYLCSGLCPVSGGTWNNGATAGAWALALNGVRSDWGSSIGCRAASYL